MYLLESEGIRGKPDWWTVNKNADVIQFLPFHISYTECEKCEVVDNELSFDRLVKTANNSLHNKGDAPVKESNFFRLGYFICLTQARPQHLCSADWRLWGFKTNC